MPKKPPPPDATPTEYTVVARRYRPQQFAELIGQEHVAQALVNALQVGRVAHAYLFTGARGVGKTSAARILAKALNCETGTTPTPCDTCESCLAVAAGEDVDVLEIDGASNNKVEEVRDLRQNVGFRPTRGRYKIYIIDEVHMLSTSAFNALLKTLEEPPPHVKFIFATTEVQKIPVTILSRCQRFDFAHVGPGRIFDQLKAIVTREGHQADDDALKLVARRAAGSMRDSQSLLDQLLAAGEGKLTAEQVHAVLGTAGDERVTELAAAVLKRDAKTSLNLLAGWVESGLQVGELVDQLVEYWRSLMLVSCGGPEVGELPVTPAQREAILQQVRGLSLDTILTGLEVWTTTKGRMRGSNHSQVLLEMALVRLSRLDEMLSVSSLIQGVSQGAVSIPVSAPNNGSPRPATVRPPEADGGSKKNGLTPGNPPPSGDVNATLTLSESTLPEIWERVKGYLTEKGPVLAGYLKNANLPAIFGPNSLAIPFDPRYNHAHAACATEANTIRVQDALRRLTGQAVTVKFELKAGLPPTESTHPRANAAQTRKRDLMQLPLFKKAAESLGAQLYGGDDDFNPVPPLPQKSAPPDNEYDTDDDAPAPDPEEP